MPAPSHIRPHPIAAACGFALTAVAAIAQPPNAGATAPSSGLPLVTNVAELRQWSLRPTNGACHFRLEGDVWWMNAAQGRLVFQDASGADELEMNLESPVQPGQRVRLEGRSMVARRGARLRVGVRGPVVDNDGIHGIVEKSGATYLEAGHHSIRVEWFNGADKSGLELDYEGPGLPRQRIPDAALFRTHVAAGALVRSNLLHGLDYRCYEGVWRVLPDFDQLTPVKTGTTANFDLSVQTRAANVALQFAGFIEVPSNGTYAFKLRSDDGSRLLVGARPARVEVLGPATFPGARRMAIGRLLTGDEPGHWAEVEGKVTLVHEVPGGLQMELSAGAGRMRVEVGDGSDLPAALLSNRRVRMTGFCESAFTTDGERVAAVLLVPGRKQIEWIETAPEQSFPGATTNPPLPLLTTADAVHRLRRDEARREYPARIRGVVTGVQPEHQAFTIQDVTRGLYVVDFSASRPQLPAIGEFLEVEGTTDPGLFAPFVNARRVTSLGAGHLPEPARPTWDQLMNGSLDAQYVELSGIIAAVQPERVTLLTREGRINMELRVSGLPPQALAQFENALVRIRGCLFATWDYLTHQVKVGEVRVYDADVTVEQPAPTDIFAAPRKMAADLLLFDPHAGAFQRVKVAGQIVHVRGEEHFMMDEQSGLRFITKESSGLQAGDLVEATGFPELSSSVSPILREAIARKTGRAPLPAAKEPPPDDLVRAEYDATRVRVEGFLMSVRPTQTDTILEMQNGVRTFVARLHDVTESAPSLPVGGRLGLVGVYAALGGNRAAGREIASFELLLNSAADIRVLARPPWWTLRRLLVIVGALACVLTLSALWITQLRRQVAERGSELEVQIRKRQRVEHQHALEQERARIAQDLHDELGSGITEISMLAARAKSVSASDQKRSHHLEQVGDKAREMVTTLDEIVWAMNPRHDSLASLVSYFSLYADRFLGLANLAWRLEPATGLPDHGIDSRHRHQLFLAFKEALTNVVRHSRATEVRISIALEAGELRLAVADNGCGLSPEAPADGMDGVANMRARLQQLGGRCEVTSEPGRGTRVLFCLPAHP